MKAMWVLLALVSVGIVVLSGCSSFVTIHERQMNIEDIISMTKAGVGPEIIKSQIEVTNSRFTLTSDEIITLKKAGVDDKVIEAMIETELLPESFDWEHGMSPYDYWFNYYNSWYPSYSYPYFNPYAVYRDPSRVGRFYRYYPVYPPSSYYQYQRWIHPEEDRTTETRTKN